MQALPPFAVYSHTGFVSGSMVHAASGTSACHEGYRLLAGYALSQQTTIQTATVEPDVEGHAGQMP